MTVGVPPVSGGGPALMDQSWTLGVAQGRNFTYQSGITAKASGTQAAATQISVGAFLYEVDTCANDADSVKLFPAIPGHSFVIANVTGHTLDIYASDGYNGVTGSSAADKINNSSNATAYSLTTYQTALFMCGKAGIWQAIKTA